jgi:hypothetical protein
VPGTGTVTLLFTDLVGSTESLLALDTVFPLFHEIYVAAIGGTADDWAARDDVIDQEGHTAVLVRPTRIHSNSAGA